MKDSFSQQNGIVYVRFRNCLFRRAYPPEGLNLRLIFVAIHLTCHHRLVPIESIHQRFHQIPLRITLVYVITQAYVVDGIIKGAVLIFVGRIMIFPHLRKCLYVGTDREDDQL